MLTVTVCAAILAAWHAAAAPSPEERARLEALINKSEQAGPYRTTTVSVIETTSPADPAAAPTRTTLTTTSWQDGKLWRTESKVSESAESEIWIRREDGMYYRAAGSTVYLRQPRRADAETSPRRSLLDNPTLRLVGTETVKGKDATVIEYTDPQLGTSRVWLSNEYGLPLKQVTEPPQSSALRPKTTVTTEWTEYAFGPVSASTFEVPQTQVQDAPTTTRP